MNDTQQKQVLRFFVRNTYRIQKLRIQTSNMAYAFFVDKLKRENSELVEKEDSEQISNAFAKHLKEEYTKIVGDKKRLPTEKTFKGADIIQTYSEFCLLEQLYSLHAKEDAHFRQLEKMLRNFPIYTEYLQHITGVGPALAGVIISEIDISKSKYPASLWKYAGFDVVIWFELKVKYHDSAPEKLYKRHPQEYVTEGPAIVGVDTDWMTVYNKKGEKLGEYGLVDPNSDEAQANGAYLGRSKRKEHLVDVDYITSSGSVATKKSITFNPFVKTKLVLLASSFLRAGKDNTYAQVYYQYKERLDSNSRYDEFTKKHKHNMALRYTIKRFLVDLHINWRRIEGLPVSEEYTVAKAHQTLGKSKVA